MPKEVDYLSLDIEPAAQTYTVLESLPLDTYRFGVITYEHDRYVSGDEYMIASRLLLGNYGYKRVASNVSWEGRDFEDWYVHPEVVSSDVYSKFESTGKSYEEIFGLLD